MYLYTYSFKCFILEKVQHCEITIKRKSSISFSLIYMPSPLSVIQSRVFISYMSCCQISKIAIVDMWYKGHQFTYHMITLINIFLVILVVFSSCLEQYSKQKSMSPFKSTLLNKTQGLSDMYRLPWICNHNTGWAASCFVSFAFVSLRFLYLKTLFFLSEMVYFLLVEIKSFGA